MKQTKVLHIIKSLGRGGAEMLLPETLRLHRKEEFDFHYIYFLPWKTEMVSAIKDAGGKVTCIPANNNIQLMLQGGKVIDYCREHDIEIIHCHLPWAGFLGRYVYKRTGIPVVYTEHNLQERYHPITRNLNKYSYNFQTLAIGVSEDVTDSIVRNLKPRIPVISLLNGVNTRKFIRQPQSGRELRNKHGIPEDAIVIGNVAVFRFQKRIKEWVQVFQRIEKKNPNVYGIVVGFGPLEEEIKAEVQRLGLEEKIIFPGLQKEVRPYFSAMDIFMMSSSFEGLPIALLEAMSMECAIVTTAAGGIKEAVRDQKEGLICGVEEWEHLSDMCQELMDHPAKLQELGKAARERVVNSFSLRAMVNSLEQIYEKITREGKYSTAEPMENLKRDVDAST